MDTVPIGSLTCTALFTPFHTPGHVCFYVTGPSPEQPGAVFTGDCMFVSGAGNLNHPELAPKMREAFTHLGALPGDTRVYVGHEYTKANMEYAKYVEPQNPQLAAKAAWVQTAERTVPSTIAEEKE